MCMCHRYAQRKSKANEIRRKYGEPKLLMKHNCAIINKHGVGLDLVIYCGILDIRPTSLHYSYINMHI